MGWPAPPSGVVGSPANSGGRKGYDEYLGSRGVDLGKNVCSVVGLDASGAVVMRRKMRRETLTGLAEKLPACVVAMEACVLRLPSPRPPCLCHATATTLTSG